LVGDIGLRAQRERIVRVHNLKSLEWMADKYKTTVEELIKRRAAQLGFCYQLPAY